MNGYRPLAELLSDELRGDERRELGSFLGAGSDEVLAAWVEQCVERALRRRVVGALFASKSAGAVFGLQLDDGERVVLKLFWPRLSRDELLAAERCLDHVIARGFPAPVPLARVFATDRGLFAAIYEHAHGTLADPHAPEVSRELAARLAQLSELLADVDPRGLPPSPAAASALFWPSHRASIDLELPRPDAAWIDDRARAAQAVVRAARLRTLPAHLDWTMANMRFHDGRVCAVLDWDSLAAASEPDLVGRAAAFFTAQWELPVRLTPSREEARAFVDEYEAARGRRFSATERTVLSAAADYAVAQVARLQHAAGEQRADSYVELLRDCTGEPLL